MRLHTTVTGAEGNPRLAIVHGLFGQARNWGRIQKRLSDDFHVTAVDLRNHGDSDWSDAHSYPDLAADLAETLDGPTHVLGHSMGGKAAMALALLHPGVVERLIVADIAPVPYDHSMIDYVRAMQSMDLSALDNRADADAALAEHIPERGIRAFLLQNLDVRGKAWGLNLDVLGREMDGISGWPSDIEGSFGGSTLFLSGANSDYLDDEGKAAARRYFPHARFAEIPDAGHWLHAERPDAVVESARVFLSA